jgi:hypothetical protein
MELVENTAPLETLSRLALQKGAIPGPRVIRFRRVGGPKDGTYVHFYATKTESRIKYYAKRGGPNIKRQRHEAVQKAKSSAVSSTDPLEMPGIPLLERNLFHPAL